MHVRVRAVFHQSIYECETLDFLQACCDHEVAGHWHVEKGGTHKVDEDENL